MVLVGNGRLTRGNEVVGATISPKKTAVLELVEQFQVDQSTVQKYVREAGLPRRLLRLSPEGVRRTLSRWKARRIHQQRLNVLPPSVRRALRRADILRTQGGTAMFKIAPKTATFSRSLTKALIFRRLPSMATAFRWFNYSDAARDDSALPSYEVDKVGRITSDMKSR